VLRAGLEPATCRLGVDNRNRSGPQQGGVAVVRCGRERGVEPHGPKAALTRDNRAAPARDESCLAGPPGLEPGPARLELAVLPLTPRAYGERTTRIERASPEWRSGALPAELRPPSGTPGWSRTSGLCRRRAVLFPLSYGRVKEPPAGVEPAPRPYKGRVLAVDTTEAKARTGGVEPPQHEAARLQPVELTDAQRPRGGVTDRTRTGTAEAHNLGCSPLTPRPPRAGTTGLEPATSRLTSERSARLSYAPERGSAGGIRTHDLELMRLARTAAPLPRSLAGRSRTCDLRRPKPVGWPAPLQPEDERVPPAGFEPAPSGLRARRHHRFDHGGRKLRRQGSNLRLASNSRACCPLHHAGIDGGSRTRTCERRPPPAR
jgi:hypothetical protein